MRSRRTVARRQWLAAGAAGAVASLTVGVRPAEAAHDVEDLGLGLANPTSGPVPVTTTTLHAAVGTTDAFAVRQQIGATGDALNGYGGANADSSHGGDGVYGGGGALVAGSGSGREAGRGIVADGGAGGTYGKGGVGLEAAGGTSFTTPGEGRRAEGGRNFSGPAASGASGVRGIGGTSSTGVWTGVGVLGQSGTAEGVRGESTDGPGTLGVSANYVGLYGVSANHWGLYAQSPGYAGVFQGSVYIAGGLRLVGGFLSAAKHPDGGFRATHGVTGTTPVIEDTGRARLQGGKARVDLEPTFAALIQTGEYAVFVTPEGDCNGLYVTARGPAGFDVQELRGGTSTLDFSYRIVAPRLDMGRSRLERLPSLEPLPGITRAEIPRRTQGTKELPPITSPPAASAPARRTR